LNRTPSRRCGRPRVRIGGDAAGWCVRTIAIRNSRNRSPGRRLKVAEMAHQFRVMPRLLPARLYPSSTVTTWVSARPIRAPGALVNHYRVRIGTPVMSGGDVSAHALRFTSRGACEEVIPLVRPIRFSPAVAHPQDFPRYVHRVGNSRRTMCAGNRKAQINKQETTCFQESRCLERRRPRH